LLTGQLILAGTSGVWVFKTVSTLITSSGSSVIGGDPCNVWWRVGSSATLGTTTSFIGTVISQNGVSAMNTGATLTGRFLALSAGTVTLDSNTIATAPCSATIAAAIAARQAAAAQAAATTLPSTGITPSQDSTLRNVAILAGILIVATLFVVIRRKKRAI
jgi:hypothetical protein